MSSKRTLITGGAGFLGSHLCDRFIADGDEVICVEGYAASTTRPSALPPSQWPSYHGVDTRIVRIFNTYGPRMRLNDGRVLPTFLSQAMQGRPFTVFGGGSQTPSFQYVDDLVEGVFASCTATLPGRSTLATPLNFTILEFAQ